MDAPAAAILDPATLEALFRTAVPSLAIEADPAECAIASADLSGPAPHPARLVLRPATAEEVRAIVLAARRGGIALYPRGGGLSYTAGFRPGDGPAVMVDTGRLQAIAIDPATATVEAGAGVTWETLHAALAEAGLRTPSFGPLSGIGATVGGGAAQNGGFFGNASHGALGDGTVCGGTMVDGTGTLVRLGPDDRVDGILAPQPLVGDCGAFGIRTSVVLRTIPVPPVTSFASFDFPDGAAALGVLAGLAGLPNLGEAYVFDPGTHANLARTGFSVIESAGLASDLMASKGGLLSRLGALVRTARAGKAFVADLAWSLHLAFDGTRTEVDAAQEEVGRRALAAGGEVIPDIIPRVTRARPFRKIKALLGPDGEAWLPLHGVFPAAAALPALAATRAALAEAAPGMQAHGIRVVILAVLMGRRVVIEPQLFWPDAMGLAVRRLAQPNQVAEFGDRPANPADRAAALALRTHLTAVLDAAGATHFQLGRSYAGHTGLPEPVQAAWAALKRRHDPDRIINPGALGL